MSDSSCSATFIFLHASANGISEHRSRANEKADPSWWSRYVTRYALRLRRKGGSASPKEITG